MKQYLICFVYLCFATSFNNGHTLSRIEINNNTVDVYAVNEGESTLTITHPKDDKTILREIVYFHVIEKPYDKQKKTPEINKRYFTNGHGYQYVDGNNDVIDDDVDKDTTKQDDETEQQYDDEDGTEDVRDGTDAIADEGVNIDDDEKNDTIDEVSKDNVADKDNYNNKNNNNNDSEIKEIFDTETHNNDDENKKGTENLDEKLGDSDLLIDEATQAQPASRRKRDLDYSNLPEPPKLPGFNWNILPDYIKAIILADQDDENDLNSFEDEIEKQVRKLKMAANHPPSVERENDDEERDARSLGNNLDIVGHGGDKEATYGMSLAGSSGKIWNNINSHHLHYVSEAEALAKTNPTQIPMDITTKATVDTDEVTETAYLKENDFTKPSNNLRHIESIDDAFKLFKEVIENSENKKAITNDDDDIDMKDSNSDKYSPIQSKNSKKREVTNNNLEDDKSEGQKREFKTYGMRLAGDSGVVWNDVHRHLAYHIGEPESTSTVSENDGTTKTPIYINKPYNDNDDTKSSDLDDLKDIEESLDQINKMLDELINITHEANENITDKPANNTPDDHKNNSNDKGSEMKDIEDSFDEINKILEELINNNTSVSTESSKVTNSGYDNESTTASTAKEDITTESSTGITTISNETDKPTTAKPEIKRKNNGTAKHDEESKQKQFVKELMKNKFFWQWLQDSSAAYLEVMMKKLDDLIKVEVDKQIKQYFDEHKNITSCTPNSEPQNKTSDQPIESNNVTNTIDDTEKPTTNTTLEEPYNKIVTNTNKTSTQNPADITDKNNILNNTLDKNGQSKKTENDLEKKNKSNDKDTPVKIDAHNVYGNSVGNGKVTNFFIFNINNESDLERIKQLGNETNGVFVFGLDNKTGMGKPNKNDKNNESKDVTVIPEKTNENKEENKHDIEKVSTAKPETVTKPVTEELIATTDSIDSTVEDKQTTPTESIETITINKDASTKENIIESTTIAAKESIDDETDAKSKQDFTTESPENNHNKPEKDDETQEKISEKITSTTENSKDNVSDGDSKDSNVANIEEKDKTENINSESTTDKVDTENTTEKDTVKENEIDKSES